jgi:hypothetical protein
MKAKRNVEIGVKTAFPWSGKSRITIRRAFSRSANDSPTLLLATDPVYYNDCTRSVTARGISI